MYDKIIEKFQGKHGLEIDVSDNQFVQLFIGDRSVGAVLKGVLYSIDTNWPGFYRLTDEQKTLVFEACTELAQVMPIEEEEEEEL